MEGWANDRLWLAYSLGSSFVSRNGHPWIRAFKILNAPPRRPAAADHFPLLIAIPSNPTAVHRHRD
jgi:hypothetical protein